MSKGEGDEKRAWRRPKVVVLKRRAEDGEMILMDCKNYTDPLGSWATASSCTEDCIPICEVMVAS